MYIIHNSLFLAFHCLLAICLFTFHRAVFVVFFCLTNNFFSILSWFFFLSLAVHNLRMHTVWLRFQNLFFFFSLVKQSRNNVVRQMIVKSRRDFSFYTYESILFLFSSSSSSSFFVACFSLSLSLSACVCYRCCCNCTLVRVVVPACQKCSVVRCMCMVPCMTSPLKILTPSTRKILRFKFRHKRNEYQKNEKKHKNGKKNENICVDMKVNGSL